jgi:membrane dipeptidase
MRRYFEEHGETLQKIYLDPELDRNVRDALIRTHFASHVVPQTSLDVLLDHFDHALAIAGPDHVGLGADWDGVASMPIGLEDVSRLPALTAGLLARGHSAETVEKVLGENLLRVLESAELVAHELRGGHP